MQKILKIVDEKYMIIIFLIGGAAVFISLYFSNVADLTPCMLCWYQRIFFYPIFFLAATSLAIKEKISPKYILMLGTIGMVIAAYHYAIQKLGLQETLVTCTAGIPCNQVDFELLGFITIPFLSLVGFAMINLVTVIKLRKFFKKDLN